VTDLGSATAGASAHPATTFATRVLLVEDDEGDAFLVRELLLDAGSDVTIARVRSLAEASLELPGEHDCVLLDLGLPDANGLEALGAVLEAAPNLAVLVLTGLADEHRGIEALAAGAQDYLVKGTIDGQLLTRAIRYAVERKRADESVRRLYASELRAAENSRLERGLLPEPVVHSSNIEATTRYRPGRHQSLLGGDFYDLVETDDGTIYAVIGDVAGHGPDEAALGVCLRIAWRTLVLAGVEPEAILPGMDAVLVGERDSDETFATVSMVRIAPDRRSARFWQAGHPLPLLLRADDTVGRLPDDAAGAALGVVSGAEWTAADVELAVGSRVLLFTDGLIEGYDGQGGRGRLGESGLEALLSELLVGSTSAGLAGSLLARVQELIGGELTDDVALLLVSWGQLG
jgi:serine phosphatase RsbU (regulator of sigma subunit)